MGFTLLTVTKAAKELGLTRRMLNQQINACAGPAVTHIGASRFIRSDELAAWVERNTLRDFPQTVAA